MPHTAAVVAAPMRKLWPAYLVSSMPACHSAEHTACRNASLVSGVPFLKQSSGPGELSGTEINASSADTGHTKSLACPRHMSLFLPLAEAGLLKD